jgi:uncharacterized repeat protein (TIGR01451 family)
MRATARTRMGCSRGARVVLACAVGLGWTISAQASAAPDRLAGPGSVASIALQLPLDAAPDSIPVNDAPLAELIASDSEGELGSSVSVSGSTVVAGAPREDDTEGISYVFGASKGAWSQQAELTAGAERAVGGLFGKAVAISGNAMVVGAPGNDGHPAGKAFVLTYSEAKGAWSEPVELAPDETGSESNFGHSVAISGSTVVVGAPGENGDPAGRAYVFTGSGSSWSKPTELDGPAENRDFGASVAISGSTVIVGDPEAETGESVETGAAYVFTGSGESWSEPATLTASDGAAGDEFGRAVAVSGSTVLVGAPGHTERTGAAYVFTGSGASWSERDELSAGEDSGEGDYFGEAVAISGSTAIVGAPGDDTRAGAAYVFTGAEASWAAQSVLTPAERESEAAFGDSLSVSGSMLAVGAPRAKDETGVAYVYELGPPPPAAELSMTAHAAPNPVELGEDLEDTFTIANAGPEEAEAVVFADELPSGVTLKLVSASQGSCNETTAGGKTTASCALGSLAEGAHATVKEIVEPTRAGVVSNTATVSSATEDLNLENNTATATATAETPIPPSPPCEASMTVGAVTVLADCISEVGNGTYTAVGNTRFSDGASIVLAGTQTPAPLIVDPAAGTIALAPAVGGGAQTGELEVNGVDVGGGRLAIDTQGVTDPVSGVAGSAKIAGLETIALSLSSWVFEDVGITPTAYLLPSGAGGGVVVDGRLTLPAWLGAAIEYGPLGSAVSGQLAVQVAASGQVSVLDGGITYQSTDFGLSSLQLAKGQLSYQRAGDVWTGSATLGFPNLANLVVNTTIGQGKLDELTANFTCAALCSGPEVQKGNGAKVPSIGAVLDLEDASLEMINLQGISYTPFTINFEHPVHVCITSPRFKIACPAQPPPPPPPKIEGRLVAGALGNKIVIGGNFTALLDGAFSAEGTVGLAPLHSGTFPEPAALEKNQSAQNVVNTILKSVNAGVELAGAQVSFTPPSLLQASGEVFLPPLPFPVQFLEGKLSIGIDPPHFTGEGSLSLVVPGYVPIIGGDRFGGVEALVSDAAAAGEVEIPGFCIHYIGCTPSISVLVAFDYANAGFTIRLNGGSINEYATVPQAVAGSARVQGSHRAVRVPGGKQMATFTVSSARGTPNVRLLGPPGAHRRVFTLASSKRLHNRTGALAWTTRSGHSESFLVFLPAGGRWTVSRIGGAPIAAVKVTVPRHKLHAASYPHAAPRAGDLPKGTVSTSSAITLHYSVPHAAPGTTVELWAGTGPHGAGGVMIADGLPPSGSATWKFAGLAGGRYWPYAIVNQNGIPISIQYWPGSVEIVNPDAPAAPTDVQAAAESGQVLVGWNEVAGASTYAVTATPASGGATVRDAVPASQLGDQLTLAPGQWSIAVQAVDAEDIASLPSAPSSVTVP